jgi:hypothetical protein
MRIAPGLLACLLAAGVVGCGDDAPSRPAKATATPARTATATATAAASAEQRGVEAVLQRYAQAVRAGDAGAICDGLLSREVLRRVKQAGGDCERDLIADAVEAGGPSYALKVASVEVTGARATARTVVTDRRGTRPQDQPLVREGGDWRLSVEG